MSSLSLFPLQTASISGNPYMVSDAINSEKTETPEKPTEEPLLETDSEKKMTSIKMNEIGPLVIKNANGDPAYELTQSHIKIIELLRNEFIKSEKKYDCISSTTSGLPRRILLRKSAKQVQLFLLMHKKSLGDPVYGEGTEKKVKLGHNVTNLQGGELPMVASISMLKNYSTQREISKLTQFHSIKGFAKFICAFDFESKSGQKKVRLIQPFYEKGTLDNYKPHDFKEVLFILHSISSTLTKLKGLNNLHRDLKPSQIFLTGDEEATKQGVSVRPVVGDLATVCRLDDYENLSMCLGTLPNLAPEVIDIYLSCMRVDNMINESLISVVSPAVDVWGIGCIMYELFKGKPWNAYEREEQCIRKLATLKSLAESWDRYDNPTKDGILQIEARCDVSGIEELRPLLRQALHPNPKKRISIEDLQNELGKMLDRLDSSKEEKKNSHP